MDMLQEMRLSANLQRVPGVSAETVALKDIFRMATVDGSHVLGWGELSGTLEPGKRADMVLLDGRRLAEPYLSSEHNPIHALLYRGRASDVDTVMVDGEILYRGKKHLRLDAKKLLKQVKASVEPAAKDSAQSVEAELLAHAIRYYQAWDEEPLVPYHRVNSI